MREILFKGKLIDRSDWVTGFLVIDKDGTAWIVNNHGASYTWDEVIPETVCQYIGIKDTVGQMIFENSIMKGKFGTGIGCKSTKYKEFNFSVTYHGHSPEFHLNMPKNYGRYRFLPYLTECIVIGNLFDHKELLQSL